MRPVTAAGRCRRRRLHDVLCARERRRAPPGQVRSLKSVKAMRPGQLIAVGGCIGQRDGEQLSAPDPPHRRRVRHPQHRAPCPALLDLRIEQINLRSRSTTSRTTSPRTCLPSARAHGTHGYPSRSAATTSAATAWCRTCAGVSARGRLRTSSPRLSELNAQGVVEVTLLGQNVNSYGRDLYGSPRFAEALRTVAASGCAAHPVRDQPPQGPLRQRRSRSWPRSRRSCRTCTCRCSPARIGF